MVKFSSEYQPSAEDRRRETCRKGHSMVEGDSNVRVRKDGRRVCHTCESARQAERYLDRVRTHQPIARPFTIDNMWYEEERYEATSISVLQQFNNWQKMYLSTAKAAKPGAMTNGVSREFIIEHLELEIPKLEAIIIRRAVGELTEDKQ
jgi:hypothetical protein